MLTKRSPAAPRNDAERRSLTCVTHRPRICVRNPGTFREVPPNGHWKRKFEWIHTRAGLKSAIEIGDKAAKR